MESHSLTSYQRTCWQNDFSKFGAGEGNRTPDPRITNALLYQLSYPGAGRAV